MSGSVSESAPWARMGWPPHPVVAQIWYSLSVVIAHDERDAKSILTIL